ncbi:sulfite oxidase [Klebsormidium nitens]|uniref:Sulfite oxidase n=1 Tax=Klebsormidium nitens TaxID=105231 RepID=A0A1Y1HRD9_KLENI|nr:sulfite oxidase [Klebsormidium nitens]|eukprot:GAQ79127.1 sulfite oxidase [Klebsormidium nitens]
MAESKEKHESGLLAPTSYDKEPPRDPSLIINSKTPFNAEPPVGALAQSFITPTPHFYKRNHGPIPILENEEEYRLTIDGLLPHPIKLTLAQLKSLGKEVVVASLMCAGNRRTEMSRLKAVRGVGWGPAAVGNAVWGGVPLSRVLQLAGVSQGAWETHSGGRHVEFVSVDRCKEEKGGPYRASIPLHMATCPDQEVLLAYEMNGEPLPRDHGCPLRAVVPGVIGARSVKWLDRINILADECQGFFQQLDYKMFPPWVDWDNVNWSSRSSIQDFPVQLAVCSPTSKDSIAPGSKVTVKGYALSGGGRKIERVDVSVDGGATWAEAQRLPQEGTHGRWAWTLWSLSAIVNPPCQIIAKCVDVASNTQPERVETIWNLRGVLNNSWFRVDIEPPKARL